MISSITRLLFPISCFGCGKRADVLCERCIGLTRRSLSSMHPFIFSTFDFRDPLMKRIIHAIKYHNRRDLLAPLIPSVLSSVRAIPDYTHYTLIPIPMPTLRKLFRGYNQAELLAAQLGAHTLLPVRLDILQRTKSSPRQAMIHEKAKRLQNQRGAFTVSKDVRSLHILLIDDVTTTGATLVEARKVLLQAGAASVLAVTIAH